MDQNTEDIAVATKSKHERIVALDIIRGFFLIVILIDHIELYPSGFDLLTGRGRLFVSAAEGFFFMSGLLVGMVYRRRLALGIKFIFKRMWGRALELYLASVFFTLLFSAAAVFLNHPSIKDGLYSVINWPHIVKETVLMRYGFGWADFLDRFAILMFLAPFGFYLLARKKWWLLLILSFGAWCLRGAFLINNFTISWQLLFMGAMIIGYYWYEIKNYWHSIPIKLKRNIKLGINSLTAVTFAVSYASVFLLSFLNERLISLPAWLQSFTLHWNTFNTWIWLYTQKWTLGPVRLILFMLWFTSLFMFIQRYYYHINSKTRGIVEMLGRNSLLVYIAHAFVVFVFKLLIPDHTNLLANFSITTAALFTLIAVVAGYKELEPRINKSMGRLLVLR